MSVLLISFANLNKQFFLFLHPKLTLHYTFLLLEMLSELILSDNHTKFAKVFYDDAFIRVFKGFKKR